MWTFRTRLNPNTTTGKWMTNLKTMLIIDDTLYVHAGTSAHAYLHTFNLIIDKINQFMVDFIGFTNTEKTQDLRKYVTIRSMLETRYFNMQRFNDKQQIKACETIKNVLIALSNEYNIHINKMVWQTK